MNTVKRTYTLPENVVHQFEREVPTGSRSGVLTELLNAWIQLQERARLRRDVIEGCRDMTELYLELEREYHSVDEEVHRVIEP